MQARILSLHTPSTPWVVSKGQNIILLKVVMMVFISKGMENRTPCKHIFCPSTQPNIPDGAKRSFFI